MATAGEFPFRSNGPASESILSQLLADVDGALPADYIEFLRHSNGDEGFVGDACAALWRAEDLIQYNRGYEVREYAPTLFVVGSNGGGEAYAFDLVSRSPARYQVPFIGMGGAEATKIADSFAAFMATGST